VIVHSIFDLLAVVVAAAVFWRLPLPQSGIAQPWRLHPAYVSLASLGMMAGALAAGTGNLLLSGYGEASKSVLGGLAGAILAVELLKRRLGITASTGLRFAAPLAAAIAVGRLGCFFSGIEDRTYGTPTDLPLGYDFGDGILRHPVELYEAVGAAAIF
jgi:phosphatidylglycerol:prolipoprotein diacylglycerol transferase